MVSAWGVVAGVAAVLAVVVTSLIVGVCLAVARITDAVQAARRRQGHRVRGGGAGSGVLPPAGSGRRYGSGAPTVYQRGNR